MVKYNKSNKLKFVGAARSLFDNFLLSATVPQNFFVGQCVKPFVSNTGVQDIVPNQRQTGTVWDKTRSDLTTKQVAGLSNCFVVGIP